MYVYMVKVTEKNMAEVDGVSVTSIKTESLTTVQCDLSYVKCYFKT